MIVAETPRLILREWELEDIGSTDHIYGDPEAMHQGFDGQRIEADWALDRRFWGRGLATEAARAALDWGFATLKFERIWGVARVENVASVAVMKKVGMAFEERRVVAGFDSVIYFARSPM